MLGQRRDRAFHTDQLFLPQIGEHGVDQIGGPLRPAAQRLEAHPPGALILGVPARQGLQEGQSRRFERGPPEPAPAQLADMTGGGQLVDGGLNPSRAVPKEDGQLGLADSFAPCFRQPQETARQIETRRRFEPGGGAASGAPLGPRVEDHPAADRRHG